MKEILLALITGGVLKSTLDWGQAWWHNRYSKEKAFTRLLPQIHRIYDILNVMLRETHAERILILKLENGGGKPKLGANLYSSVLYEATNKIVTIKDLWQRQLVDEAYVEMMLQLGAKNSMTVTPEKLKPGILKNLYEGQNIKQGIVFCIAEKENRYIYLALNYNTDKPETPAALDVIRYGVNELRNLFRKHDL